MSGITDEVYANELWEERLIMSIAAKPWRVQDELIEQPSWGGRYIIDLKGLDADP